ncbi:MAG: hypothetical protein JWN33_41 [Candidatus Saccharibacteria bacterium]|nr:hypothetical protein [Candidatus Saccharibacteria bacterium]
MADKDKTNASSEPPAPEVLKPQSAESTPAAGSAPSGVQKAVSALRRRGTYRPSHKATFIGLGVVVGILAINAGVIAFFMNQQPSEDKAVSNSEVTLSSQSLDELGVSRNPVGSAGTELIVGPNSRFNGSVTIGSDVSIAGQLSLNSRFTATDASLANLQAGQTSLQDLNVNGSGTMSNLNVRNSLIVAGATQLQGAVTVSQLLTVNNSVNITGNLAVGGILSARGFQASTLVSDTTLTIGGHVITRGLAPSVSAGGAVGNNGTVSISGSDAAGTVAVNIGTGGGNGILANISFRQVYGSTPRVVVTAGGRSAGSVYVNRSATGFSINVGNSLPPGGYFFDYIVMQ